jgi:transcriptional regulator with XRE-family HTH domain
LLVVRRNPALLKRFGRALRAARDEAGLTQEELAHRAGLAVSYVSLMENGHKGPSLEVPVAIAEAVGQDPAELLHAAVR